MQRYNFIYFKPNIFYFLFNFNIFICITNNILMENKQKDVVWPIRMPKELKDQFKFYCDKNGYSMNKLMKILIEEKIKNEKK